LEIYYDDVENAWYASIPVEVGVEETKTGKKSKYIVRGERKTIQISPKGNKVASIDLGINVLASVVVNDGTWLLYKGVRIKQDYFYLQKEIAEEQSLVDNARNLGLVDNARNLGLVDNARNLGLVDNARNLGEYEAQEGLNREKRRLFEKLTRRLLHLYRNLASDLLKRLHDQGVSIIYLGYPYNIAQDKGNKFTVNMWLYRMLMNAIELKAQEYGMKVYEVVEYNTSRYCAFHDVQASRNPRGVVSCPKGHKLHSDLNGALNILKKAVGIAISTVKKPSSFLVLHNGVAPVKGCNT